MDNRGRSVLFLGKRDDTHTEAALSFCRAHFTDLSVHVGEWGEPLPSGLEAWTGEYLISYLSRWVVPAHLLESAKIAINFHPGPPEYPGIGCTNFALYENATHYGVTCHHMTPRVDVGPIIAVDRFEVLASDTVETLLLRTYTHQLALFHRIARMLVEGEPLPTSADRWARKPSTRTEFNELRRVTPDMSHDEIARRVRATSYGIWQPYIELHGFSFALQPNRTQ